MDLGQNITYNRTFATAPPFLITSGLSFDTSYSFTVLQKNSNNIYSAPSTAVNYLTRPTQPTELTITDSVTGGSSVDVTINFTRSLTATSYSVNFTDLGQNITYNYFSPTAPPFRITSGLSFDTSYSFTVLQNNNGGVYSASSTAVKYLTRPAKPTITSVTDVSSTSGLVDVLVNLMASFTSSHYTIYYATYGTSTDNNYSLYTSISSYNNTMYARGLLYDTSYSFYATTDNNGGISPFSDSYIYYTKLTQQCISSIVDTSSTSGLVDVSMTLSSILAGRHYTIYYAAYGTSTTGNYSLYNIVSGYSNQVTITGLSYDTSYSFYATTDNRNATPYYLINFPFLTRPTPATSITVPGYAFSLASYTLTFTTPLITTASRYVLYYSTDGGNTFNTDSSSTTTTIVEPVFQTGSTYYVYVASINSGGTTYSAVTTVTPVFYSYNIYSFNVDTPLTLQPPAYATVYDKTVSPTLYTTNSNNSPISANGGSYLNFIFSVSGALSLRNYNPLNNVFVLAVGGGGGGGGTPTAPGGGGGGGGFVQSRIYPLSIDRLKVTIGSGGKGYTENYYGVNGSQTKITGNGTLKIIADGGGGGNPANYLIVHNSAIKNPTQTAGSTGGVVINTNLGVIGYTSMIDISMNDGANDFTPRQGYVGYTGSTTNGYNAGGGAGGIPVFINFRQGFAAGGIGKVYSLNSNMASPYNSLYLAGGGGSYQDGSGGLGGGGKGGSNGAGINGTANTGGGGGNSVNGGSGIAIIMVQVKSTPDINSISQSNRSIGTVDVSINFNTIYPTSPTHYILSYTNTGVTPSSTNTITFNTPLSVPGYLSLYGISMRTSYSMFITASGDITATEFVVGSNYTYNTG
jgi:hypothetical protein